MRVTKTSLELVKISKSLTTKTLKTLYNEYKILLRHVSKSK